MAMKAMKQTLWWKVKSNEVIPVKSTTFRAAMSARRESFSCWVTTTGSGGRGYNLVKRFPIKEGQELLPGEFWWGGHREIYPSQEERSESGGPKDE